MPPQVTRQSPVQKTGGPAKKSVLDRVAPVAPDVRGIKMNVYGRGKTGKTRLSCTFPKPLLLIGTEDGTKSISNVPGVDFIRLSNSTELAELTDLLRSGQSYWKADGTEGVRRLGTRSGDPYVTAVLDTAGGLQDMILKEILNLDHLPVQKSWGMAKREDWMVTGTQWKERMVHILNLADQTGMNVVIIAHERSFNEEGNSDVMVPTVGAALTPTVAGWLNASCDYICHTFIRNRVETTVRTVAGKEVETQVATGRPEYCLRVGAHPVYMTGFRVPDNITLPEAIPNPTYEKIAALIAGEPLPDDPPPKRAAAPARKNA